MLTFILLAVLGGGLGLLAVVLAGTDQKPATEGAESPRAHVAPPEPDDAPPVEHDPIPALDVEPAPPVTVAAIPDTSLPMEPADRVEPQRRAGPVAPPRPRRVRDPRSVPRSLRAVEGRFEDVARAPLWRRIASLAGIGAITVLVGVAIAAVLGASIGAVAEIVGNTIG